MYEESANSAVSISLLTVRRYKVIGSVDHSDSNRSALLTASTNRSSIEDICSRFMRLILGTLFRFRGRFSKPACSQAYPEALSATRGILALQVSARTQTLTLKPQGCQQANCTFNPIRPAGYCARRERGRAKEVRRAPLDFARVVGFARKSLIQRRPR